MKNKQGLAPNFSKELLQAFKQLWPGKKARKTISRTQDFGLGN